MAEAIGIRGIRVEDPSEVQWARMDTGADVDYGALPLDSRPMAATPLRHMPADLLFALDTTDSGHKWRLIDDQPWKRAYRPSPLL